MGKASVAANISGQVDRGDITFTVTDPTLLKTFFMDGGDAGTALHLLRRNYDGDGWEPVTMGGRKVQMNDFNRSVTITHKGVFTIDGIIDGTVSMFWTDDLS